MLASGLPAADLQGATPFGIALFERRVRKYAAVRNAFVAGLDHADAGSSLKRVAIVS